MPLGNVEKVLVDVRLEGLQSYDPSEYNLTFSYLRTASNLSLNNLSASELGGIFVTNNKDYPVVIIFVPEHMIGTNNDGYPAILAIIIKRDPSVNNGYYIHDQVYAMDENDGGFYYAFQQPSRDLLYAMRYKLATNLKVHLTNFTPRFSNPFRS